MSHFLALFPLCDTCTQYVGMHVLLLRHILSKEPKTPRIALKFFESFQHLHHLLLLLQLTPGVVLCLEL